MNDMIAKRLAEQHARRVSNLETILFELRQRPLTSPDMAFVVGVSSAGARNYREDLLAADLIKVLHEVAPNGRKMRVYCLQATPEESAAYIKGLRAMGPTCAKPVLATKLLSGSRIHLAGDETNRPVRSEKIVAFRDSLVAALFGPARGARGAA
jgi:hypothetical protein